MATTRPALAGLGGSRAEIYGALSIGSRLSVATARRQAELSRSDGLHAPSTEQRGYQAAATLHRWECSRVFFVAEPAGRPGLRLWGAPPQRWACFRMDQLSDKPRAAPEPQDPSRRTCHGRIQTLAEDQSRQKIWGRVLLLAARRRPSQIGRARGYHQRTCIPGEPMNLIVKRSYALAGFEKILSTGAKVWVFDGAAVGQGCERGKLPGSRAGRRAERIGLELSAYNSGSAPTHRAKLSAYNCVSR